MSRSWPFSPRSLRSLNPQARRGLRIFDVLLAVLILGLFALIAARLDRVEIRQVGGTVIVNDGDSLTLAGERIRLRGIDAPELNQTCSRDGQTYGCGRKSKAALQVLIAGRPVVCEGWQRDRYRRLLATCKSGDTDLNRSLVSEGWAVAFGGFDAEERAAQKAGLGLWAGEFVRPAEWRSTHGSLVEGAHDAFSAILDWIKAMLGLGIA